MRMQGSIVAATVFLLLLGIIVHAQPSGGCVIEGGTAAGGEHLLTALAWQVTGTASGGEYRLLGVEAPTLRGSGCCCSYLPLVLRNLR